jgi:hypothetical protein
MMGPSLETGAVFDAVLSVNYCANCDSVSVRACKKNVMKKVWELPLGTAMLGVGSSAGPLLEKREKGRTRGYFLSTLKDTRVIVPRKVAHPPR